MTDPVEPQKRRMPWFGRVLVAYFLFKAAWFFLRPNWEVQLLGGTHYFRDFLWDPPEFATGAAACWVEATLLSGAYILLAYCAWRLVCRYHPRHPNKA